MLRLIFQTLFGVSLQTVSHERAILIGVTEPARIYPGRGGQNEK